MKRRYFAIALLAYGFFLIVTAPASWIGFGITRATHGAWGLAQPEGSFWKGRGTLYLAQADGTAVPVGPLSWRLFPGALLLGRAEAQIALTGPITLHLRVRRSWGTLALKPVSAIVQAAALTPLNPDLRFVKPSGEIVLKGPGFVMTRHSMKGHLRLSWSEAGTDLSSVVPLGYYTLDAQGAGGRVQLHLGTVRGPLLLTGEGFWDDGGRFALNGTASAAGDDPRVRRLVRFLGRRTGPHTHAFSLGAKTAPWHAFL